MEWRCSAVSLLATCFRTCCRAHAHRAVGCLASQCWERRSPITVAPSLSLPNEYSRLDQETGKTALLLALNRLGARVFPPDGKCKVIDENPLRYTLKANRITFNEEVALDFCCLFLLFLFFFFFFFFFLFF
jgi:hypothetical protein